MHINNNASVLWSSHSIKSLIVIPSASSRLTPSTSRDSSINEMVIRADHKINSPVIDLISLIESTLWILYCNVHNRHHPPFGQQYSTFTAITMTFSSLSLSPYLTTRSFPIASLGHLFYIYLPWPCSDYNRQTKPIFYFLQREPILLPACLFFVFARPTNTLFYPTTTYSSAPSPSDSEPNQFNCPWVVHSEMCILSHNNRTLRIRDMPQPMVFK